MCESGSADFDFQIQAIAGRAITPSSTPSESAETRLSAAKRTVDQNYYELDGYIDGDLAENPMFLCLKVNREDEGFEALRLFHNYLTSLYSLNETIRVLVNQHTDEKLKQRQFAADLPYYGRQLSFLRGLRTDFQHGGFSCLRFDRAGELGDFAGYHVVFDRKAFVDDSGLRDPGRFLQHTNEAERQYPLCFTGRFHQETVQSFYEDTERWFASASN